MLIAVILSSKSSLFDFQKPRRNSSGNIIREGAKKGRGLVCKIALLARALGPKAARPSARATIGYHVYKRGYAEHQVRVNIVC